MAPCRTSRRVPSSVQQLVSHQHREAPAPLTELGVDGPEQPHRALQEWPELQNRQQFCHHHLGMSKGDIVTRASSTSVFLEVAA